jgi:Zn-dependent alcohol dehydrogenase
VSVRSAAAIYVEKGRPLVVDEVDHGDPGPHDVIVRILVTGICHSFLHRFHMPSVQCPHLFGHEATGVVEAVGRSVTRVREGERVFVTWLPGTPQLGLTPDRSTARWHDQLAHSVNVYTWAQHCRVSEHYVVPCDDATPDMAGSIIGCAVMTGAGAVINTARVQAGQTVAVFGVGGVGLAAVQAAANAGASAVVAVDLVDEKLVFARRFGATEVVNAGATDAVAAVRELTHGGVDFAFDTIGAPATVQQIVLATRAGTPGVRRGGMSVLVGVCLSPPPLDLPHLMGASKSFVGCVGGDAVPDRDFAVFTEWYKTNRLPLDELVTQRYELADVNEALDDLEHGRIAGRAVFDLR